MRFSERAGFTPVRLQLQRDEIDEALKAGLWTALKTTVFRFEWLGRRWEDRYFVFVKRFYIFFWKKPVDDAPSDADEFLKIVRRWFFAADWFKIYDLVEFCYDEGWYGENDADAERESLVKLINQFLEQEKSAFRLVSGFITELTNEGEIESVEAASSQGSRFSGVSVHIQAAVSLYSDRKSPDYRNSVKEAVSAVEAAARVICQDEKATLGSAIKVIDKNHSMHSALRDGLLKIYGYSSDEGGIRHSLIDHSKVDHADAKFMIVSCSAFCNFLIEKYGA